MPADTAGKPIEWTPDLGPHVERSEHRRSQQCLVVLILAMDGPGHVDHIRRRHVPGRGECGDTGLEGSVLVDPRSRLLVDRGPTRERDRPCDAPSMPEFDVGGVHDGIETQRREICPNGDE